MTDSSESDKPTSEEQEQAAHAESESHGEAGQHAEHDAAQKPNEASPPNRTVARALAFAVVLGLGLLLISTLGGSERRQRVVKSTTWSVGQKHDLELTLVAADKLGLSCASKQTFEGRHCAFESSTTAWPGGPGDDKTQLRPYNTTEQDPLLISGLWSDPALSGALPTQRFGLKCTFTVEGKMTKPSVRWATNGQWIEEKIDWPVGSVSGCKLIPPKQ